jgi:hypothetical protein
MPKLTIAETTGLRSAVQAEHESKHASAAARERFESVALFDHLEQSAARHIAALCKALHSSQEKAPVLTAVTATSPGTLVDALKAAEDRETQTAAIYDEILQHTSNAGLKSLLLPLWQSVSHLHLIAITDQLSIEQNKTDPAQPPTHVVD